jgi:hypothetical protein
MRKLIAIAAAAVGLSLAAEAGAADYPRVVYQDGTGSIVYQDGTGFFSRATIQRAFGWSDGQLGQNHKNVTFTLEIADGGLVRCSSGARQVGPAVERWSVEVKSKWQGQFTLLGYGATTILHPFPAVGDPCPNDDGSVVTGTDYVDLPNISLVAHDGNVSQDAYLAFWT